MHVKNGDVVKVISGNHKGQVGEVKHIDRVADRVVVEGVNVRTVRLKKTQQNPQGGEIEQEMSIHVSNVALWDEAANKVVRRRSDLTKS